MTLPATSAIAGASVEKAVIIAVTTRTLAIALFSHKFPRDRGFSPRRWLSVCAVSVVLSPFPARAFPATGVIMSGCDGLEAFPVENSDLDSRLSPRMTNAAQSRRFGTQ